MAVIPYATYRQASQNWKEFWGNSGTSNSINPFLEINPWEAPWEVFNETVIVPQGSVRKFEMLASPHYKTILRAWCIREGKEPPCTRQVQRRK